MAFLADAMLGSLTRYLRMMGYDVLYAPDVDAETDDEIIALAEKTDRRIITRDTEVAGRTEAIHLESLEVEGQLRELDTQGFRLELTGPSRCSLCNGELRPAEDSPENAPDDQRVWCCSECGQYYWKGSHWRDVRETLEEIRET